MKVWISKYALTDGITQHTAKDRVADRVCDVSGFVGYMWFTLGVDAHTTKEAAVQAAEQMRKKKIASLKKQIAKLEAMKFEE